MCEFQCMKLALFQRSLPGPLQDGACLLGRRAKITLRWAKITLYTVLHHLTAMPFLPCILNSLLTVRNQRFWSRVIESEVKPIKEKKKPSDMSVILLVTSTTPKLSITLLHSSTRPQNKVSKCNRSDKFCKL